MLTLSVVDRGFKLHSAETRDFNIGIVSSAKHTGLRSNSKNWLARILIKKTWPDQDHHN
jgi:hypothetical protein